ncbi:MAG: aldo/keto reductase [Methanobacteriota archaeon]|nr:MAG: aldo/keto reductase [Euryarchaeota archaeon]
MKDRTLGRTGLKVSEVGFGAWAIGGNAHGNSYGPTDDKTSIEAVRRAVDLGCTFFDTADVYGWGHSEEILGEALEGRRGEVRLATKVGGDFYHGGVRMNFDPGYLAFALDRSLKRLRTDHVDLYQLHNPPADVMGDPTTYDALDSLKAENKILHYGVSIHEPYEGLLCIEAGKPESLQVPFSVIRQEWVDELFADARKANVGIIAREPLANGFLAGKLPPSAQFPPGDIRHHWPPQMVAARASLASRLAFLKAEDRTLAQAALRFVLAYPEVSTTIPGCKTPAQVEEDLHASDATPLSAAEVAKLRELYAKDLRR